MVCVQMAAKTVVGKTQKAAATKIRSCVIPARLRVRRDDSMMIGIVLDD